MEKKSLFKNKNKNSNSKKNLYNKMNINSKKYILKKNRKKVKKVKKNIKGGDENGSVINKNDEKIIVNDKKNKQSTLSLIYNFFYEYPSLGRFYRYMQTVGFNLVSLSEYLKGIVKNPKNIWCGLLSNESNDYFKKNLGIVCDNQFLPLSGGRKELRNSVKNNRKYKKKYRKITNKKIKYNKKYFIGGKGKLSSIKKPSIDKIKETLKSIKKPSLGEIKGFFKSINEAIDLYSNDKKAKIPLNEKIPELKIKFFNYFSTIDINHLYLFYFTIINIKNAAIYKMMIDADIINLISENETKSFSRSSNTESLDITIRQKITELYTFTNENNQDYVIEQKIQGLLWFYINFKCFEDDSYVDKTVGLRAIYYTLTKGFSHQEKFNSLFQNLESIVKENDTLFSYFEENLKKYPLEEINIKNSIKNTNSNIFKKFSRNPNKEELEKIQIAITEMIKHNQDTFNIIDTIEKFYKESKQIYYNKNLFSSKNEDNVTSITEFFKDNLLSKFEKYISYNDAFINHEQGGIQINKPEKFRSLQRSFKESIYKHPHEFDPTTATSKQYLEFYNKFQKGKINNYIQNFDNNPKILISIYSFIEDMDMIHIIETCLFKDIYTNIYFNESLAKGQKIQDIFYEFRNLELSDLMSVKPQLINSYVNEEYSIIREQISKIINNGENLIINDYFRNVIDSYQNDEDILALLEPPPIENA